MSLASASPGPLTTQPMTETLSDARLSAPPPPARTVRAGAARLRRARALCLSGARVHGARVPGARIRQAARGGQRLQALLQALSDAGDIELLARATGAGDEREAACAQTEGLEDRSTRAHLVHRVGGERDADRIADPLAEQQPEADRRAQRPGLAAPSFGDAEMERGVGLGGQEAAGGDGEGDIARLGRDLVVAEVRLFQKCGVAERARRQSFRRRPAVLFQEVALQRAGIDADADGAAVVAGGTDDLAHPLLITDVAGVEAKRRQAAPASAASMARL